MRSALLRPLDVTRGRLSTCSRVHQFKQPFSLTSFSGSCPRATADVTSISITVSAQQAAYSSSVAVRAPQKKAVAAGGATAAPQAAHRKAGTGTFSSAAAHQDIVTFRQLVAEHDAACSWTARAARAAGVTAGGHASTAEAVAVLAGSGGWVGAAPLSTIVGLAVRCFHIAEQAGQAPAAAASISTGVSLLSVLVRDRWPAVMATHEAQEALPAERLGHAWQGLCKHVAAVAPDRAPTTERLQQLEQALLHSSGEGSGGKSVAAREFLLLAAAAGGAPAHTMLRRLYPSTESTASIARLSPRVVAACVASAVAAGDAAAAVTLVRTWQAAAAAASSTSSSTHVAQEALIFRAAAVGVRRSGKEALASQLLQCMVSWAQAAAARTTDSSGSGSGRLGTAAAVLSLPASVEALSNIMRTSALSLQACASLMASHPASPIRSLTSLPPSTEEGEGAGSSSTALVPVLLGGKGSSKVAKQVDEADAAAARELKQQESKLTAPLLAAVGELLRLPQPPLSPLSVVYADAISMALRSGSARTVTALLQQLAAKDVRVAGCVLRDAVAAQRAAARQADRREREGTTPRGAAAAAEEEDGATTSSDAEDDVSHSIGTTAGGADAGAVGVVNWCSELVLSPSRRYAGEEESLRGVMQPPLLDYTPAEWDTLLHGLLRLSMKPEQSGMGTLPARTHNGKSNATSGLEWDGIWTPVPTTTAAGASGVDAGTAEKEPAIAYGRSVALAESRSAPAAAAVGRFRAVVHEAYLPHLTAAAAAHDIRLTFTLFDELQKALLAGAVQLVGGGDGGSEAEAVAARPSAAAWQLLITACADANHPKRAARVIQMMADAGLTPNTHTLVAVAASFARKGHVDDAFLRLTQLQADADAAADADQEVKQENEEVDGGSEGEEDRVARYPIPESLYTGVMAAACGAHLPSLALTVLRHAQARGMLHRVDYGLHTGVLSLSGLPEAVLATVLLDALRSLRKAVRAGTVPAPPVLRLYHSPPHRSLLRGLLQSTSYALIARTMGIGARHRHLLVDGDAVMTYLTTPLPEDEAAQAGAEAVEAETERSRKGKSWAADTRTNRSSNSNKMSGGSSLPSAVRRVWPSDSLTVLRHSAVPPAAEHLQAHTRAIQQQAAHQHQQQLQQLCRHTTDGGTAGDAGGDASASIPAAADAAAAATTSSASASASVGGEQQAAKLWQSDWAAMRAGARKRNRSRSGAAAEEA